MVEDFEFVSFVIVRYRHVLATIHDMNMIVRSMGNLMVCLLWCSFRWLCSYERVCVDVRCIFVDLLCDNGVDL